MNKKKFLIFIIFLLIILFMIKCNYVPIIEKYEELNIISKTNDDIIKYLINIDEKIIDFGNEINNKLIGAQQKYDELVVKVNSIGLEWIQYKPTKYIKCLTHSGNGVFIDGVDPEIIPYDNVLYLYMIQGKMLRIKFSLKECYNSTNGTGLYYVKLPIVNSIQLKAKKTYLSFTSDFKNDVDGNGFDYVNSSCNGVGIYQNSNDMYLLNCFMFDNEKIMFNTWKRNSTNLGLLSSVNANLNGEYKTWFFHFTMDIPIE